MYSAMPSVAYLYELYDSYYLHLAFEMAQGDSVADVHYAHDEDNSGDDGIPGSSPNGMGCSTCANSSRTTSSEDSPTWCSRTDLHRYPSHIPKVRHRCQTTHS